MEPLRPERIAVLPMIVVGVALLLVAPVPMLGVVALAVTLAALLLPARFEVTRNEQALLGVTGLSLGIILPRAMAPADLPAGAISDGMYSLGMAAQLSGVVRLFVAGAVGGARVTCAIGLVAMAAAGRGGTASSFAAQVALFGLTALAAMAADDPGRPAVRRLGPRHLAVAAAIALASAGAVVAAADLLPPLQARIIARLMSGMPRTGFTDRLQLGDMQGLAMSSELVARVRGAPVDHLRGVVFRRYSGGEWHKVDEGPSYVVEAEPLPPDGPGAVEIEMPGKKKVYPAPLGASSLWVSTRILAAERQGILRPSKDHEAKRLRFRLDPAVGAPGIARDPVDTPDLTFPEHLQDDLEEVLAGWGATGLSPRATVDLIHRRLTTDYTYSLEFRRKRGVDPVIDFLLRQKLGHCEYFAAAATLLARAAGIPARLVGGWRVVEQSPLSDYMIVRERDAHAWTEVHLDGRWEVLDATPGGPIASVPVTSWGTALVDLVSTQWERFEDWLARRSQLEMSLALVSLLVSFVLYRVRRSRSERRTARATGRADPPLPAFVRLSRALESAGVPPRAAAEPIESWAGRLDATELHPPLAPDDARAAAEALRDYAAFRYGAPRDEEQVLRRLAEAAAVVERRDLRGGVRPSG